MNGLAAKPRPPPKWPAQAGDDNSADKVHAAMVAQTRLDLRDVDSSDMGLSYRVEVPCGHWRCAAADRNGLLRSRRSMPVGADRAACVRGGGLNRSEKPISAVNW